MLMGMAIQSVWRPPLNITTRRAWFNSKQGRTSNLCGSSRIQSQCKPWTLTISSQMQSWSSSKPLSTAQGMMSLSKIQRYRWRDAARTMWAAGSVHTSHRATSLTTSLRLTACPSASSSPSGGLWMPRRRSTSTLGYITPHWLGMPWSGICWTPLSTGLWCQPPKLICSRMTSAMRWREFISIFAQSFQWLTTFPLIGLFWRL